MSQKKPEYMLNYSLTCSCSYNLSSFWLLLKQQWTIEEISIFSNSGHFEWRAGLLDTILKDTHLRTIPARFGLIRFRVFRGEDLNVKVYDVRRTDGRGRTDGGRRTTGADGRRTPSDGKSSHGLWPGEYKRNKHRIAIQIHRQYKWMHRETQFILTKINTKSHSR